MQITQYLRRSLRFGLSWAAAGAAMACLLAAACLGVLPPDAAAQNPPAPEITTPADHTFRQGETITPIPVRVSPKGVAVTVSNLPPGLGFSQGDPGQISGTVTAAATGQAYTVTIRADDGVNAAVTATFNITVATSAPQEIMNAAPAITNPGDKSYRQGEAITAFGIIVTDADGDAPAVTVSGLPSGLKYANGQVQGTVAASAAAQAYTVAVSADDGVNAAVTDAFTITVTENAAPAITNPGNKTYKQGEAISAFGIIVADADDSPRVTVTGLPSGLSYASGQVQGTVSSSAAAQAYTVTISADDGVNAAVTDTFTITVAENAAPAITNPGDKSYEQGEAITAFGITVTDADGDTPTVTVSGLPSGLKYASGQVQGTVSASAAAQAYTVTVSADDGVNAAVTDTFTITVTTSAPRANRNAVPVITTPGDKSYKQGEAITAFTIPVSDADGDTVAVQVNYLPPGLGFSEGDPGHVSGTVAASAAAQVYTVKISAFDGTDTALASFTITVTENAAPVIANPSDKSYKQDEAISAFGITVTDADGDTPTVTVSGLPSGLKYASGQVQGTVSASAAAQAYTVTVSADDGVNAAVTATFTITVTTSAPRANRNAVPVITNPGDKSYKQGEAITAFTIPVSDADGDTVEVQVNYLPPGLGFSEGDPGQVSGTVAASAAAQAYTVKISAFDGTDTALASFTITVSENAAPVITNPGDKSYEQGEAITAFGITVTDADGDTPTVTVSGLPSGLKYASDQVQGTVSASAAAQAYTVTISADDGVNAAVTDTFTITVTTVAPRVIRNAVPVITKPGDKTYRQGEAITAFTIPVSDADGDTVAVQVNYLPPGLGFSEGDPGHVSGTVAASAAAQAYTVKISAFDGTDTALASFTITVSENAAPVITNPGDKSYEQGEAITAFGITVTDADGDTPTVTVSGLPSGLKFASGQVQGTVSASAAAQAYTVTVSADDGVNAAVTGTFTITVTTSAPRANRNAVPVITNPGDKSYKQGEAITAFTIPVSDADGDTLAVQVNYLPPGLGFSEGDPGQVSGTVAASAAAQAYTVKISAFDGTHSALASFTITVSENAAPVIANPGDKSYEQDEAISAFGITVTDADGDTPTVTVTGLPPGLSYASGQVQGTVSASAAAQAYAVTVSADDGVKAAVTDTFTITVTTVAPRVIRNAVPVITKPGDKSYKQGETITAFTIPVSDADGDTVAVQVNYLPSGLGFTQGDPGRVSGTVAASAAAQAYTVKISAYDGTDTALASFTITVSENAAPAITNPGDKSYKQGEAITAFGITVTDADGDTPTVTVSGLPPGLSYASGQVQGTVSASAAAQAYAVTVSADDGVNAAVTDTFTITVTTNAPQVTTNAPQVTENAAPVITNPGAKTYQRGETITAFGIPVTDVDDTPTVTVAGLPTGLSYVSGQVQGTVSASAAAQGYTVTISADDGVNAAVTDTFTITVAAVEHAAAAAGNAAPVITNPGSKTYQRGETITAFGILVTDVDDTPTVTVAGLPTGLSYVSGQVQGTVSASAAAQGFLVTISADDGVNAAVTDTFTITVAAAPAVTIEDAAANEGDALTFTVTLDKAVSGGLTVTPGFGGGTAAQGADYTANTTALTFAGTAGETQTFAVATAENTAVEPNRTFTVRLTVSGTQAAVTANDTATGAIVDDDTATVTIADAAATEGTSLTFAVKLDAAVHGGLKVTPVFSDGTATAGLDYQAKPPTLTFTGSMAGETRTFTVPTTEDDVPETAETFTVGLSVAGTSLRVTATDTATGTINEKPEQAAAELAIADAWATEGDALSFTVILDQAVSGGLKVTPVFTGGTATGGTDYSANMAALTFAGTAGEAQSLTVATTEDVVAETAETFTVSLAVSGTSETVTATDTATGTITDDDAATVTIDDAAAREGDVLIFAVKLDTAIQGGLSLVPVFRDGTAVAGADYTAKPDPFTFTGTAGETRAFTVATLQDEVAEPDESFFVSLAVSGTSVQVRTGPAATGTISEPEKTQAATSGARPVITNPGPRSYEQGETIAAFGVNVTDADGDPLDLTLTGLPLGLSYASGSVSGTVAAHAPPGDYPVTITARDGADAVVTSTFTITVTARAATVTGLQVSSSPATADTYGLGETIRVTVSFSEAVRVAGAPTLALRMDPAHPGEVRAAYESGAGTRALTFAHTVGEPDVSRQGIAVVASSLRLDQGAAITAAATGSQASLAHAGLAQDARHKVDWRATSVVSVADARAEGGKNSTLDFVVTLDRAISRPVTVDYATADGTATAGADYEAAAGTLTFAAGETSKTVMVRALDDPFDEGEETLTFTLSNPSRGLSIGDGEAIGTLSNTDPLPVVWTTRFGRGVATHVMDALESRFEAHAGPSWARLGGQQFGVADPDVVETARHLVPRGRPWDSDPLVDGGGGQESATGQLLLDSAFHLASNSDDGAKGPRLSSWGRVTASGFDSLQDRVSLDGTVTTATLGLDGAWRRWVTGVALAYSEGAGSFTHARAADPDLVGELGSTLTSFHPYVSYALSDRVRLWGMAGYGNGEFRMDGPQVTRADLGMTMGALGARGTLLEGSGQGGLRLELRSDALWLRMDTAKVEGLVATGADVSRLRVVLEGSRAFALGAGGILTPALEMGLRHDGGDAETGSGVEVGGRIRYATAWGLMLEASLRTLVAHADRGYKEWAAAALLRFDPHDARRGLSVTLAPAWGEADSAVERLWDQPPGAGSVLPQSAERAAAGRFEAELAYGVDAPGGRGVLIPYSGMTMGEEGVRHYRVGSRLELDDMLALSLEVGRREAPGRETDEGVMLGVRVRP